MKKKITAIILSVLMLLSVAPFAMAGTLGDVDSSGKIDATDARTALRAAVGLDKLTDEQFGLADVNFDGKVDATDARLILRAAVGLENLHVHKYEALTTAATCEKKGKTTYFCDCGDSYSEEIPATGHIKVKDEAVYPTCTEAGKTVGEHCSACGKVFTEQKPVKALGHKVVLDVAIAPTCTETGLSEGNHCRVCNKILVPQEIIPASGHIEAMLEAKAPTCTEIGFTEGKHCSVCKTVFVAQEPIPMTAHTEAVTPAVPATCTAEGKTEGKHCSVCEKVLVEQEPTPKVNHTEEKIPAVPATCNKTGLTEGAKCAVCDKVFVAQEIVPMTSHTEAVTPAVPATCSAEGKTEGKHCSVCETVLVAPTAIPKAEHSEENLPAVPATCKNTGLTEGKKCSVCGEVVVAQEVIPLAEHNIVVMAVAVAPTCTEAGYTEATYCTTCDTMIKVQETIPPLGHDEVITEEAIAPTCMEEGKTAVSYCKVCEMPVSNGEAVPPVGHEFKTMSFTNTTKCTVPGCDGEIPAFNTIVNGLKSNSGILSYFTGIFEDISHYSEPVVGGTLAGMMEEEGISESTEVAYAPLTVDRLITQHNFQTNGADYVSDLKDGDVKSITVERVDTVDFVEALPTNFNSGKFQYDISKIKTYDFPELYKITIVVPEVTVDIAKPVSGTFVHDKIYTKNYRNLLEDMRLDVAGNFDTLSKELAGLEGFIKMSNSGNFKTALTIDYYVKADTYTPVAAKYSHIIDVNFNIKLTDSIGFVTFLTMKQQMDMTSNSYYFFNNSFGIEK